MASKSIIETVCEIDRLDEIRREKEFEAMGSEEYRRAIRELIPSGDMRLFLEQNKITFREMCDLAIAAAVALNVKEKYLSGADRREMTNAIEALRARKGDLFFLYDAWYDREIGGERTCGNAPFTSFDGAVEAIRAERDDFEETGDEEWRRNQWYYVEKWSLEENERYVHRYTYTVIGTEPVYFTRYEEFEDPASPDRFRYGPGAASVYFPVPYEVGELLCVDCSPFAPPIIALLIEKTQEDAQILYLEPFTRQWNLCSLGHGIELNGADPRGFAPISPLLNISRFTGEPEGKERALFEAREYVLQGDDKDAVKLSEIVRFEAIRKCRTKSGKLGKVIRAMYPETLSGKEKRANMRTGKNVRAKYSDGGFYSSDLPF